MEFDHLKGFYHVAKFGSFTEAAARLYISQPAISLQVKALESELGERLFDRVGRTIRLTHAGKLLYKEAEELVGKLDEVHRAARELKSLERACLTVGASDTLSMHFLPRLFKAFLEAHPKVELRIVSLVSAQVARKVLDRDLDLGIVTLPLVEPRLEIIPAFEQRFVAIVPEEHPLAARGVLDFPDLAAGPLILLEGESLTRRLIEEAFARSGCECRPSMELSNFEIAKRFVACGLGVSLVPQGTVSRQRDGVCPVPLRRRLSVAVGMILRRERRLSRAARSFLAMASDFFSSTPPVDPPEPRAEPH
jgi:DNA-binding transcriptional LysR family regulator